MQAHCDSNMRARNSPSKTLAVNDIVANLRSETSQQQCMDLTKPREHSAVPTKKHSLPKPMR